MTTLNKHTTARLIPVIPAITFDCTLNGKPLKATFTHTDDHPINIVRYISFSDGYSSSFTASTSEERKWYDENKRTDYAIAIAEDLEAICGYFSGRSLYCFAIDLKGKKTNVWALQDYDDKGEYKIYYGGDYRFTLQSVKGGYEAFSTRKVDYKAPDEVVAKQVAEQLTALQN